MRTWPGRPYPLGAAWDGEGVNFAIFSENATAVELCLFDGPDSDRDSARIRVEERGEALRAYEFARAAYRQRIKESEWTRPRR